jgi:hypothetical protein
MAVGEALSADRLLREIDALLATPAPQEPQPNDTPLGRARLRLHALAVDTYRDYIEAERAGKRKKAARLLAVASAYFADAAEEAIRLVDTYKAENALLKRALAMLAGMDASESPLLRMHLADDPIELTIEPDPDNQ